MQPTDDVISETKRADDFRKFIEMEVLKAIKVAAEKGETPKEKIQEMARYSLDLIQPGMPLDALYMGAVKLDDQFSELGPVVITIMKEYEEKYEMKALEHVSALIKSGKYEDAQDMVKKVLQFKIQ